MKHTNGSHLAIDTDFKKTVWLVLREIKKDGIATPADTYVTFLFQHLQGVISNKDQERVMRYLAEQGAIKIIGNKYPFPAIDKTTADILHLSPIGIIIDIIPHRFEELYLDMQSEAPTTDTEVFFDQDTSTLHFLSHSIVISKTKNSDAHYLLAIIFQEKDREWDIPEIREDTRLAYSGKSYDTKKDWRKIYNAGREVNDKVAKKTAVEDFLALSKMTISIKKKYLQ